MRKSFHPSKRLYSPEDDFFTEGNQAYLSSFQPIINDHNDNNSSTKNPSALRRKEEEEERTVRLLAALGIDSEHENNSMATLKNKVSSYTASEPTTSTPSVLSEKGNVNSTILVDAPTKFSTFNKFNNNNFNNYNNNDNNSSRNAMEIHCDIPGCGKVFPTTFAFESHYSAVHRHSCRYCKKVFPTSKLLSIHLLETHDTLFMVMSERKPMYECLVEGCSQLFWDALLRKEHLVDTHQYPTNYDFGLSVKKEKKTNTSNNTTGMLVSSSNDKQSTRMTNSNRGVPKVVNFGRSRGSKMFNNSTRMSSASSAPVTTSNFSSSSSSSFSSSSNSSFSTPQLPPPTAMSIEMILEPSTTTIPTTNSSPSAKLNRRERRLLAREQAQVKVGDGENISEQSADTLK